MEDPVLIHDGEDPNLIIMRKPARRGPNRGYIGISVPPGFTQNFNDLIGAPFPNFGVIHM